MTCDLALNDGAYVLGSLSSAERQEFETHLAGCVECSRAVRELAGLPGLLSRVDPEVLVAPAAVVPVPETLLPALLHGVRGVQRRRMLVTAGTAAAATLVVALGSLAAAGAFDGGRNEAASSSPSHHAAAPVGQSMLPVGRTPVRASLAFTSVLWGTRLDLTCTYVGGEYGTPPAQTYTMVVRTRDGQVQQVASWRSLPGRTMRLAAATAASRQDITSVEVRTAGGNPVLELTA